MAQGPVWGEVTQTDQVTYDSLSALPALPRLLPLSWLPTPGDTVNPSPLTEDQIALTTDHSRLKFYRLSDGRVMAAWDEGQINMQDPNESISAWARFWDGQAWGRVLYRVDNGMYRVPYLGGMAYFQLPDGRILAAWDCGYLEAQNPDKSIAAYVRLWDGSTWGTSFRVDNGQSGTPYTGRIAYYQLPDGRVLAAWNRGYLEAQDPGKTIAAYVRLWDGTAWETPFRVDNGQDGVPYTGGISYYQLPAGQVLAAWDRGYLEVQNPDKTIAAYVRLWDGSAWGHPFRVDNGQHGVPYSGRIAYYQLPNNQILAAWDRGYWVTWDPSKTIEAWTRFWNGGSWSVPQRVDNGLTDSPYHGYILYRQAHPGGMALWILHRPVALDYYKRVLYIIPKTPHLLTPSDQVVLYTPYPTFDWADAARATGYTLQISTSESFMPLTLDTTLTNSSYVSDKALTEGGYFWRVQAFNLAGPSAWSETWSFQIVKNTDPVAQAGGPYAGLVGSAILFDGSGSYDPDDDPLTYFWDFGDGETGSGVTPQHMYTQSGFYTVVLTVDDGHGGTDSDTTTVFIYPLGQQEILADEHTVLLDHFNGITVANNIYPPSSLTFTESLPGLAQAGVFVGECQTRYDTVAWYYGNINARGSIEALVQITTDYAHDFIILQWYKADNPPAAGWVGRLRTNEDGKLYWWTWGSGAPQDHLVGKTPLPKNQWVHVAVTWGTEGTKLYVNGRTDTASVYNICPNMAPDLYIYSGTDFGYLDELHISNVQRSDEEIYFHHGLITEIKKSDSNPEPLTFHLEQNYPNPFNSSTVIAYQIPLSSHVVVKILNLKGQEVITLIDAIQRPGYYTCFWNGRNHQGIPLASGLYLYRLKAGSYVQTRKLLLIR